METKLDALLRWASHTPQLHRACRCRIDALTKQVAEERHIRALRQASAALGVPFAGIALLGLAGTLDLRCAHKPFYEPVPKRSL